MKMDDNEEILSHKYDPSKYDPAKRHEYYERTKKLKGRRKGLAKKPQKRRPIPISMKSLPQRTQQQQQVAAKVISKSSQTNMDQVRADIQKRSEEASKKAAEQKQKAEALAEKRFALENKKLDLETVRLDLEDQQTELNLRLRNLQKLKGKPGIDRDALEREARQIQLETNKLNIRKKKFDLEFQKIEEEIKKLNPPEVDERLKNALVHEYDPVKRHEYYERTKKLKGRRKGVAQPSTSGTSQTKGSGSSSKSKTNNKLSEQQKAEIKARVEAYKARLEKLKEVLAILVAEAKKRSAENAGTEESRAKEKNKDNATSDKGSSKSGSSTAKEKAAAKKYYEKNKEKISLKKQEANLKDQIKEVEDKIVKIRAELKDSLKKARDKTRLGSSN